MGKNEVNKPPDKVISVCKDQRHENDAHHSIDCMGLSDGGDGVGLKMTLTLMY